MEWRGTPEAERFWKKKGRQENFIYFFKICGEFLQKGMNLCNVLNKIKVWWVYTKCGDFIRCGE